MASATLSDVQATSLAGEFAALTLGQIQPFLDEAAKHVAGVDASDQVQAHALLTAHLLHGELAGGATGLAKGPVVAEQMGPFSKTYGAYLAGAAGDNDPLNLASSSYGRRYLALVNLTVLTPALCFE